MVSLGDIASIRSGYQFRGRITHDPVGEYSVIQSKNIDQRRCVVAGRLDRVTLDQSAEAYLVDQGDVLFLSRGERLYAVVIDCPLADTVAAGHFYVVRSRRRAVRPDYLAWYINHPTTQDVLRRLTQGTNLPFVSITSFKALTVPLPPLAMQQTITALAALANREQDLLAEIAEQRRTLVQTASLAAACGVR